MTNYVSNEDNFELNYLFEDQKNPVTAFNQLKEIFQALSSLDKVYLSSIDDSLQIEYSLEFLEYGSIKTWLAQLIREIPDEAIKDFDWKKLIGHFLLKLKYYVLHLLDDKTTVDSKDLIEKLQKDIEKEKRKILKESFQIFNEVNLYLLLNVLKEIVAAASKLKDGEKIQYKSFDGSAIISNKVSLNKAKILWELGDKKSEHETTEVLKIKKIDFLSNNSNWNFKFGTKIIEAKISDQNWLAEYHARHYPLLPEDSLKVKLKVSYTTNKDHKISKAIYEITKVLDIIYPEDNQGSLFE